MRFSASAVLLVLATNSEAFTPLGKSTFVPRRSSSSLHQKQQQPSRRTCLSMLVETSGGLEELQEWTDSVVQGKPLQKQALARPSLFKLAGLASIPVGAALGFGIVPSRRIAAHAFGAITAGLASAVGKSRLDALTDASAKPALAQALLDAGGLEDLDLAQTAVNQVRESFGLTDEDYQLLATDIYATYLQGMVKYSPQTKTSELKELGRLQTVLQLSDLAVGEAHAAAAAEWYRTTCLFTPTEELENDPDHPDRQAMDKLLFLTERALQDETPQAFLYEMTRTAKAVHLDYQTALERVAAVVEPFYVRALASTRSKLGTQQVSSDMLERARQTLGVSDETARDLHVAAFNEHVKECLGMSNSEEQDEAEKQDLTKVKFAEGSMEQLEQLREILGLSETDAAYEIGLEASPLYQATALQVMKDVLAETKTPDHAWKILDQRRQELLLQEENSRDLVSSMVMQALGGPLEETNKFAKVNNQVATYDNLLDTLKAKEALIGILEKSGWDEFDNFDETFCNPWDKQSANGFLSTEDRIKLYKIFLQRSVRQAGDQKLDDEIFDRVAQVQGLLGITDQQAEIEARAAFGPALQKALNRATVEITQDYTPELVDNMRSDIDEIVDNYRLSRDYLRESGAAFYARAVELVSDKAPAGIPTTELCQALAALRELFALEEQDCFPAHMEHFGAVYKKAVLEAMGSTGVIRPEVRESLDELQERLGVSEENKKALFLEAVEEKMEPMVKWIGSELERTMLSQEQLSKRRGKDMGEDLFQTGKGADGVLGLGADVNIMGDIMELIDFYNENNIAREEETGTKTVEKKVGDELVAEEVPVVETVYPVNALGSSMIDQETAELLYRQFIVSGFTSQGPNAGRYEESRGTFGGILGLSSDKMEEINSNIGSTVYDNFVTNAMQTKGTMDQQDMMFLANIQGKLGLTSEQGEKMLAESQKKILSEEVNALMDNATPAGIKAFREKCNSMGMDMQSDVGVSMQRLSNMFMAEVTPGLKNGEINPENADILTEIQESFGIEADACEEMFESLLVRLSKSAFDTTSAELLRGRDENTVELIKELIRYADFTGGDLGLEVDESTANQIVNVYEALDHEGEDADQVKAHTELLRAAVGLS